MIFHKHHFNNVLDDGQASLIAKMANQVIDQKAKVLYGTLFTNGDAIDFSTDKKSTDTHVTLALGIEPMGEMSPSPAPVALDKPNFEDIAKAQGERLRILESENKQLRNRK